MQWSRRTSTVYNYDFGGVVSVGPSQVYGVSRMTTVPSAGALDVEIVYMYGVQ